MNNSIQITPAAYGGKRSAWAGPRVAPVTHGTITRFSRDGQRVLVENAAGDGVYIDAEPGHVIGLEVTVPQVAR